MRKVFLLLAVFSITSLLLASSVSAFFLTDFFKNLFGKPEVTGRYAYSPSPSPYQTLSSTPSPSPTPSSFQRCTKEANVCTDKTGRYSDFCPSETQIIHFNCENDVCVRGEPTNCGEGMVCSKTDGKCVVQQIEKNIRYIMPITLTKTQTINLKKGLNLVSLQYKPENNDINSIFAGKLKGGTSGSVSDSIYKLIPGEGAYNYDMAWQVATGEAYGNLSGKFMDSDTGKISTMTLDVGEGFFIENRHEEKTIELLGSEINEVTLNLKKGHNHIGLPFEGYTAKSVLEKTGCAKISKWDAGNQQYIGYPGSTDFNIASGTGYLIECNSAVVKTIKKLEEPVIPKIINSEKKYGKGDAIVTDRVQWFKVGKNSKSGSTENLVQGACDGRRGHVRAWTPQQTIRIPIEDFTVNNSKTIEKVEIGVRIESDGNHPVSLKAYGGSAQKKFEGKPGVQDLVLDITADKQSWTWQDVNALEVYGFADKEYKTANKDWLEFDCFWINVSYSEEPPCFDSDGEEWGYYVYKYYKKGKTTGLTGTSSVSIEFSDCCVNNSKQDICVSESKTLKEFYCQDNRQRSETYTCPHGCKDGVCFDLGCDLEAGSLTPPSKPLLDEKNVIEATGIDNSKGEPPKNGNAFLYYQKGECGPKKAKNCTDLVLIETKDILLDGYVYNKAVKFTWIPKETGTYTLILVLNASNELDPTDNRHISKSMLVKKRGADLGVGIDVWIQQSCYPKFTEKIKNIVRAPIYNFGVEPAKNGKASLYYNKGYCNPKEGKPCTNLVLIGKKDISDENSIYPYLGGGGSPGVDFTWIPKETGNFTLVVITNATNEIWPENNIDYENVYVHKRGTNLRVDYMYGPKPVAIYAAPRDTSYIKINKEVTLEQLIENDGSESTKNGKASLYYNKGYCNPKEGKPCTNLVLIGKKDISVGVSYLCSRSGANIISSFKWIPKEAGEFTIVLIVNSSNEVWPEDNIGYERVYVLNKGSDLDVYYLYSSRGGSYDPIAYINEEIIITTNIDNNGEEDTKNGEASLYYNRGYCKKHQSIEDNKYYGNCTDLVLIKTKSLFVGDHNDTNVNFTWIPKETGNFALALIVNASNEFWPADNVNYYHLSVRKKQ